MPVIFKSKFDLADKFERAGDDQIKLKAIMDDIVSEMSAMQSDLKQLSNEPEDVGAKRKNRRAKIKKLEHRIESSDEDRQIILLKLGIVKQTARLAETVSPESVSFNNAFVAAAEWILDEKSFQAIQMKANRLLVKPPPVTTFKFTEENKKILYC